MSDGERKSSWRNCMRINRDYVPLKLIYLFFMAGDCCASLFITLFLKHLGMSTSQAGILWTVERIVSIFLPLFLGAITDKTKRPKLVLIVLLVGGGITVFSMYFIPQEAKVSSGYGDPLSEKDISLGNVSYCQEMICKSIHSSEQQVCILDKPRKDHKVCHSDYTDITTTMCYQYSLQTDLDELKSIYMHQNNTTTESWPTVIDGHPRPTKNFSETLLSPNKTLNKCELQSIESNFISPVIILSEENVEKLYSDLINSNVYLPTGTVSNLCVEYDLTNNDDFDVTNDKTICTKYVQNQQDEYGATFWLLIVLRFFASISLVGSYPVIESSVLGVLGPKNRHKFGQQRLWASVSFGVTAVLIGYLKDKSAASLDENDTSNREFLSMFLGVPISWICASIVATKLPIEISKKKEEKVRLKDIAIVLKQVKAVAFYSVLFFFGVSLAIQEIYLFWLAEVKLEAPTFILGIASLTGAILDVPFCLSAGRLIKRFGHTALISFGTSVMGLRLILNGIVTQPWQFVLVESSRGITWGLTWVVACSYTAKIAPKGIETTTMGLTNATVRGIGFCSGALLGGVIFEIIGGDNLFVLFGSINLFVSIMYGLFSFFTRHKHESDVIIYEEEKELNEENLTSKPEDDVTEDDNANLRTGAIK